ncbi:MAG TPA: TolC family protein [Vicinamibacterales bacterium]
MKRSLMVLGCLCLGIARTGAQTPLRLTLDEAIARGLEASHRVAEIDARQDAARAVEDQRKAASMPQVALQAGYTRTNHVDEFGIPGGRLIYPDIPDNVRSRVDLQWPIYSGGRTSALVRAAAAETSAIAQDRDAARADLKLDITRAYWAVITARASVDVVSQALARIAAHLGDVRNQLNVGLVPPSEVLSLEAQQARQQVLLIEAQNLAETAAADFRRLTGLMPDTPFELADRIETPPALSQQVSALVEAARASRAERKALEIRIGALGDRKAAAEAGRLPLIATVGGYDVARPNPKIFPRQEAWKPSWDIGVNLTWSLFDGGRVRAEAAEAAANQRAAQERLKDFDANVDLEVRQRAADLASAEAAIAAAEVGVRSAAEARRVIADRFSAGVATNTDVLDAQVALLQAELDRTRALANAHLAAARLDRAVGR